MTSARFLRNGTALALAAFAILIEVACARGIRDEGGEPSFATDSGIARLNACVQTECPPPFATCNGALDPCITNTSNDVNHCGGCNLPCPKPTRAMHGTALCSESQCKIACNPLYADCNNSQADGCETPTMKDPLNCGFCGNACDEGDLCWMGACGCPSGFTRCGDECKQLDSDNENCGACGNVCKAPESADDPRWTCGPAVSPPNTQWTCASGECSLLCKPPFEDCDKQFCVNGCEIDLMNDPNNCGACGKVCGPGQSCRNGACACPPGTVDCRGECVDTRNDPNNCGFCGARCPGPASNRPGRIANGSPGCEEGVCTYVCFPGYADCDGRAYNGCEAHILTDQQHCGSCTVSCNVPAGQPCFGGVCLTKECESGVVR